MNDAEELDRRIAEVESSLDTLKTEVAALDAQNPAVARIRYMIGMGEKSLESMRAQRIKLWNKSQPN